MGKTVCVVDNTTPEGAVARLVEMVSAGKLNCDLYVLSDNTFTTIPGVFKATGEEAEAALARAEALPEVRVTLSDAFRLKDAPNLHRLDCADHSIPYVVSQLVGSGSTKAAIHQGLWDMAQPLLAALRSAVGTTVDSLAEKVSPQRITSVTFYTGEGSDLHKSAESLQSRSHENGAGFLRPRCIKIEPKPNGCVRIVTIVPRDLKALRTQLKACARGVPEEKDGQGAGGTPLAGAGMLEAAERTLDKAQGLMQTVKNANRR